MVSLVCLNKWCIMQAHTTVSGRNCKVYIYVIVVVIIVDVLEPVLVVIVVIIILGQPDLFLLFSLLLFSFLLLLFSLSFFVFVFVVVFFVLVFFVVVIVLPCCFVFTVVFLVVAVVLVVFFAHIFGSYFYRHYHCSRLLGQLDPTTGTTTAGNHNCQLI